MTDDTYRFVLAEEIALWVANRDLAKPSQELFLNGLTELGQATADKIIMAIKKHGNILEVKTGEYGWTRLYSEMDENDLIKIAENAVR